MDYSGGVFNATNLPIQLGAIPDARPAADDERQNLLDFYSAGLAAYNGDRDLEHYLWITGGK